MSSQLAIYNGAARFLGEEQLATLTDNSALRRYLDGVWADGGVKACLEAGLWNFAMRGVKLDADPSLQPNFGYSQVFAHPTDYVRTAMVCQDEFFRVPLTSARDEGGYWYAGVTPIYVVIVSNDPQFGMNLAGWPQSFVSYVYAYFGVEVAPKLTGLSESIEKLEQKRERALRTARSMAAMNEGASFFPVGSWVRARFGRNGGTMDRGNPNSLIG